MSRPRRRWGWRSTWATCTTPSRCCTRAAGGLDARGVAEHELEQQERSRRPSRIACAAPPTAPPPASTSSSTSSSAPTNESPNWRHSSKQPPAATTARPWKRRLDRCCRSTDVNHDPATRYEAVILATLGPPGRMISGSKTGYRDQHPDHLPVFNANIASARARLGMAILTSRSTSPGCWSWPRVPVRSSACSMSRTVASSTRIIRGSKRRCSRPRRPATRGLTRCRLNAERMAACTSDPTPGRRDGAGRPDQGCGGFGR